MKSLGCSSIFVQNEELINKTFLYDLHSFEVVVEHRLGGIGDGAFETIITHSHISGNSLVAMKKIVFDENDDDDDEPNAPQSSVSMLGIFDTFSGEVRSQSGLIMGAISTKCIKIHLMKDERTILVPVYEDREKRLVIHFFQECNRSSPMIDQIKSVDLSLQGSSTAFDLLLQENHVVWYSHNNFISVWALQSSDGDAVEPLWTKEKSYLTKTSIPAVSVTSFDLSYPHLLVGGSDGRCQVWRIGPDKEKLLRILEHDIDSGHNVGNIETNSEKI